MSYTNFGDPGTSGDLTDFFDSGGGASPDLSSLFGGSSGGSDLGSLLSSVGQAFAAGGNSGTGSPLAAADAMQQATDPTGSMAAQQTIAGGQPATPAPQSQNQQGQGGQQGQNANQFAPQSAVDALKKALSGLAQRQRQNPWQTGGPQNAANRAAGQNSPMLNRAARIPTDQIPPQAPQAPFNPFDDSQGSQTANAADLPSANASPAEMIDLGEGGGRQTEYGWDIPPGSGEGESNQQEYGTGKNPRQYPYPSEGESTQPEYGPGATGPGEVQGPQIPPPAVPGGTSLGQLVRRFFTAPTSPMPPSGDPSTLIPPFGPWAAGKSFLTGGTGGLYDTLRAAPQAIQQPTGQPPYRPEDDPRNRTTSTYRPEDDPKAASTTTAPDTGKPVQTVDPKDKKPVNPQTGDKLPTKKGEPKPDTVTPDGHGPIARDISGVSTGVPTGLAQLAQMAMPLLMSALGGGFGGRGGRHGFGRGFAGFGGRHGFGGMRGGFHPGGRGMWPYHHPGMGWQMHGGHPGGGWLPMSHRQMRDVLGYTGAPEQSGSTGNPQLDAILQAMGIDTGGGKKGQVGFGRQRGGPQGEPTVANTPSSGAIPGMGAGDVDKLVRDAATANGIDPDTASRLVGAESSFGQNYTNPRDTNGYPSYGPFQLNMAPGAMGTQFQQQTGLNPADPRTVPQQIQWVMKQVAQNGWGNNWPTTQRNLGIGPWAGINRNFKPGTTQTGGNAGPNPQGNPANIDTTPPYVPTKMGAEAGAQV